MRKLQKLGEAQESEVSGDTEKKDEIDKDFTALMETSERLFELKYLDVYNDDKETIEYEVIQDELKIKREQERKSLEETGWSYKLEYTDGVSAPKDFGPFSQSQMEEWRKQGFFDDNDERIWVFKRYRDLKDESVDWIFISEIEKF